MGRGEYPEDVDPCRAEVFSIGLTILVSGTLESCDDVYKKLDKINEQALNHHLHNFKNKFSPYMFNILCSMLALRPNERRKCSDIYAELRPYEENILDLEPFEVRTFTGGNPAIRQSNYLNQGYNLVQQHQPQQVQYHHVVQPPQVFQQQPQNNSNIHHPYLMKK